MPVSNPAANPFLTNAFFNNGLAGGQTMGSNALLSYAAKFNIVEFGAQPGGVFDCKAAIQAAHDALPVEGGVIVFPLGVWGTTSGIVFNRPVTIQQDCGNLGGLYTGFARIECLSATGDLITATGGFNANGLNISSSVVRTTGAFLKLGSYSNITGFNFNKHYIGIDADGMSISNITNGSFRNCTKSSVATGGGHIMVGRTTHTVALNITNVTADTDLTGLPPTVADMCSFGIQLMDCDAIIIGSCDIIRSGRDLFFNPNVAKAVTNTYVFASFFDTAENGIYMVPQTGSFISRTRFHMVWASGQLQNGVVMQTTGTSTIKGTTFVDCQICINGNNGLSLTGVGVTETRVYSSVLAGNTNVAVSVANGVTKFVLVDNVIGPQDDFGPNLYGVFLNGANTNYKIINNDISGNTNAPSIGTIPASGDVRGNDGIVTSSKGVGAFTSVQTTVTVTHGLVNTPTPADISLTETSQLGSASVLSLDTTTITPTTFDVKLNVAPGAAVTFSWQASIEKR